MSNVTVQRTVFSPETVKSINNAYERALVTLGDATQHSDRRASLAKVIMELARGGEVDETSLHQRAVAAIREVDRLNRTSTTA